MSRFLIRGGCVLSMDPAVGNLREADVLIDGRHIAEIGPGIRARDAEVVDASDALVMPGFVDSHRHAAGSLFRGAGELRPGDEADPPLSPDDVYAGTLVGLLGAAEAGITTVADWCPATSAAHVEASVQAHADAGLRTVLVEATPPRDAGVPWNSVLAHLPSGAPLATLAAGMSVSDPETTGSGWSRARELGRRIHVRSGRGQAEPHAWRPDAVAGIATLLGPDTTVIDSSDLSDPDLDAIASSRAAVTLTPASEMVSGSQPPPIQKLIDRGLSPGLGIGTDRLTPGDMFTQLRTVISLQHAAYFDRKLAGKAGLPQLLTTREVIRYGTIDSAAAVGLEAAIGSLTPGKQADILLLAADHPNIFPVNDPIGAVVWGMDTSNIDWVFVAGRPVLSHGALQADLDRARDLAAAAARRLAAPRDAVPRPAVDPAVGTGAGGAA